MKRGGAFGKKYAIALAEIVDAQIRLSDELLGLGVFMR